MIAHYLTYVKYHYLHSNRCGKYVRKSLLLLDFINKTAGVYIILFQYTLLFKLLQIVILYICFISSHWEYHPGPSCRRHYHSPRHWCCHSRYQRWFQP